MEDGGVFKGFSGCPKDLILGVFFLLQCKIDNSTDMSLLDEQLASARAQLSEKADQKNGTADTAAKEKKELKDYSYSNRKRAVAKAAAPTLKERMERLQRKVVVKGLHDGLRETTGGPLLLPRGTPSHLATANTEVLRRIAQTLRK